ncbi:MAG: 4-hydroxy-tetrahydrodipicolinate reductase [Candidatus Cloacimonadota bacterium]|nr:MAG: 4-hydroxy-tetrahydrodipicolinate reductase [Candidatus Cloacimonadota bacterium]
MIKLIVSGVLGKMGKEIVSLSIEFKDIDVIAGFDKKRGDISIPIKNKIDELPHRFDAIVDFSSPDAAIKMLKFSLKSKKPFVTGTTGFTEKEEKEIKRVSKKIPVFKASNMSMGINAVMAILEDLPDILYNDFDVEIVEMHHRFKKDSPSGTAIILGKTIAKRIGKETFLYGREGKKLKRKKGDVSFHSVRGGTVVGIHTIYFHGNDESIEITHRAYSRRIFAFGALTAVRWIIQQKPGLYSMDDLLSKD